MVRDRLTLSSLNLCIKANKDLRPTTCPGLCHVQSDKNFEDIISDPRGLTYGSIEH